MPELPEVQTTVNGINEVAVGQTITDVWTEYNSPHYHGSDTVKDPRFFSFFKSAVVGQRILRARRRAKNILIDLSGGHTIVIHMKMTGHILYGRYALKKPEKGQKSSPRDEWLAEDAGPLQDPFNRFIRLVFTLKDKAGQPRHLALSDMRKFAKVTVVETAALEHSVHLRDIGPEPLEPEFTFDVFLERIGAETKSKKGRKNKKLSTKKIKPTIMDQSVIAGVGNIYADESLWRAGIHPESPVTSIPRPFLKKLYTAIRETLSRGIDFGGDSMSDYRNIRGERGQFQEQHRAYRKTGTTCTKPGCRGTIIRKVIAGRSGHFCDTHQEKF